MAGKARTEPFDEPGTLYKNVIALIKKSPLTLPELYKKHGIPYYWLRRLLDGAFKNPSVNRMEYLYKCLSGKELL